MPGLYYKSETVIVKNAKYGYITKENLEAKLLREKLSLKDPRDLKSAFSNNECYEKFLESVLKYEWFKDYNFLFDFEEMAFGGLHLFTEKEGIETNSKEYWEIYNIFEEIGYETNTENVTLAIDSVNFSETARRNILKDKQINDDSYHLSIVAADNVFNYFFLFCVDRIGIKNTAELSFYLNKMSKDLRSLYRENTPEEYSAFLSNNWDLVYNLEEVSHSRNIFESLVKFIIDCEENYINNSPFDWILNGFLPDIFDREFKFYK